MYVHTIITITVPKDQRSPTISLEADAILKQSRYQSGCRFQLDEFHGPIYSVPVSRTTTSASAPFVNTSAPLELSMVPAQCHLPPRLSLPLAKALGSFVPH
jgi:hypothetical protein